MKKMFLIFIMLAISLVSFLCVKAIEIEHEEPTVDIMFIMDLSGSMNAADPEMVSLQFVAIFADLLAGTSSQIGYVLFSTGVVESMPLTPVDLARSRIHNNVLTSRFQGWTYIPDALDTALSLMTQSRSQNQQIAILFTDGNVELRSGRNREGEDRSREIARAFNEVGIPLYIIGLNYDGNLRMDFLQELTELSSSPGLSGRVFEARENWDLPELFSRLFISLFNGRGDVGLRFDAIERAQTALFFADEGIYELNVLLMHERRLDDLTIRDPSGAIYRGATIVQRDTYTVIKIFFPDIGDWEFSFHGDYITANKMVRYITHPPGDPRTITIAFNTNGGEPLESVQIQLGRRLQNIPTPRRHGFDFDRWYLNEARTQPLATNQIFTNDIMLHANWIQFPRHIVTFVDNENTLQSHEFVDGDRLQTVELEEPSTRKGYIFIGWHLEDDSLFDRNMAVTRDLTFTPRWERIEFDFILSIILATIAALIFGVGIFLCRAVKFRGSHKKAEKKSEWFSATFASIFSILFTLSLWLAIVEYIIPMQILYYSPARESLFTIEYTSMVDLFVLVGGLLSPIIAIILLSAILPIKFVPYNLGEAKHRQYIIHFIISFVGLLWPTLIWLVYGFSLPMLWLLLYSLLVYPINFILSAVIFRRGNSKTCKFFFYK